MDRRDQFAEVYVQAQSALRSYLFALTRDRQDAEDLFQEVSLVIWRKFEQYDFSRPFLPWAFGIARFEVAQWRRKKATERLRFSPEIEVELSSAYSEIEDELGARRRALQDCVGRLGVRGRELLLLRYQQELSLDEISSRQGSTLNAINKALGKIRRVLQECTGRSISSAQSNGGPV